MDVDAQLPRLTKTSLSFFIEDGRISESEVHEQDTFHQVVNETLLYSDFFP